MAPFVDPGASFFRFTWNENKRRLNLRKHKLDLADASKVFEGRTVTEPEDSQAYQQERWLTLGVLGDKVVVIVHEEDDRLIHVISMRHAEPSETRDYYQAIL